MAAPVPVSPLAPKSYPDLPPVEGVRFATAAAGIKYKGRTDVMLALLAPGTVAAGVFTKSKCPSAPVEWCRAKLKNAKPRALVVNSGNANAFTGRNGREACKFTAQIAARAVGCKPNDIFLASTGVIGEPLNAQAFDGVMEGLVANAKADFWLDAAKAIMTTDTFPKVATATARIGLCGKACYQLGSARQVLQQAGHRLLRGFSLREEQNFPDGFFSNFWAQASGLGNAGNQFVHLVLFITKPVILPSTGGVCSLVCLSALARLSKHVSPVW